MRVIAGSAKGVRLAPVPEGTRPVSDRAREGVFSSLGVAVVGARVLDLYAGTGAMGIEALSRGAIAAVFVDQAEAAVRTIRDNLARTGLAEGSVEATVRRTRVAGFLRGAEATFDLVFVDPPYATGSAEVSETLELVRPRLARDGRIVLTRPKRDHTDVIPLEFEVAKSLGYGDTLVHLIREDPRARKRSVSGDI